MSPERDDVFEERGFERLLERAERDPAASQELDLLADLVAAAELERARLSRAPEPVSALPGLFARPWVFAAAASLLFLFALGLWFVRGGAVRPSALAVLTPPAFVAGTLRDPEAAKDAAFLGAMEPYGAGDWPAAVAALDALLAARPQHGPARFYRAAAREQLGELARAAEDYALAAQAPDALLAEHARFRLANLWLRGGELERARALLGELRDGGGELARNAAELLDALAR